MDLGTADAYVPKRVGDGGQLRIILGIWAWIGEAVWVRDTSPFLHWWLSLRSGGYLTRWGTCSHSTTRVRSRPNLLWHGRGREMLSGFVIGSFDSERLLQELARLEAI